uniref:MHD domain-containing protein n=1 Tax=Arundo donax TaxID=35708 RepID=A0A0A9CNL8_ARUDO
MVGIQNDPGKPIDSITVQFQLPPFIVSADLTANYGTVDILANKTCLWTIGQIPKDKAPCLTGNLRLEEGLDHLYTLPTFQVKLKIMGVVLSGLQIDKLEVKNTPSAPYKGFRAQTQAGKYEVRS